MCGSMKCQQKHFLLAVLYLCSVSIFRGMFGEEFVEFTDNKNISVTVDGKTILICMETRVRRRTAVNMMLEHFLVCALILLNFLGQTVSYEDDCTEDDSLREMVDLAVQRLYDALNPVI